VCSSDLVSVDLDQPWYENGPALGGLASFRVRKPGILRKSEPAGFAARLFAASDPILTFDTI